MRTPKYRVYIEHWGNSENDGIEYPKEGELHVYIGNWERRGYKKAIFQQFTGVQDSEGVEIYEGDLVEYNSDLLEVKFENSPSGSSFVIVSEDSGDLGYSLTTYSSDYKVVGNIFERRLQEKTRLTERLKGREKPNLDEVDFGTPHWKEE